MSKGYILHNKEFTDYLYYLILIFNVTLRQTLILIYEDSL